MPKARNEVFGKFVILGLLGKGGMAEVYKAADNESGLTIALKVFRPLPHLTPQQVRERCAAEVETSKVIDHPNVVRVYEAGEINGECYYSMEFINGDTLHRRIHLGPPLRLNEKIEIIKQTAQGLCAAHEVGVLHRDIKPVNIMLTYDERGELLAKITDFGIAASVMDPTLVGARKVPGTPKYFAPELIQGKPIDGRIDVYALGVTAYELLADREPFVAGDTAGYLKANLEEQPKPIPEIARNVPESIDRLVQKTLAKNPEERYDAPSLVRDLERVLAAINDGSNDIRVTDDPTSAFFELPDFDGVDVAEPPVKRAANWVPLLSAAAAAVILLAVFMLTTAPREEKASQPRREAAVSATPKRVQQELVPPAVKQAQALALVGETEAAIEKITAFLDDNPKHPQRQRYEALLKKWRTRVAKSKYDTARRSMDQMDFANAKDQLTRLVREFSDTPWASQAQQRLQEIADLEKAKKEPLKAPNDAERVFHKAEMKVAKLLAAGKSPKEALAIFDVFGDAFPDTPWAAKAREREAMLLARWVDRLLATGAQADKLSQAAQAVRSHQEILAKKEWGQRMPALLWALGRAQEKAGQREQARRTFALLEKDYPDSPQAAHAKAPRPSGAAKENKPHGPPVWVDPLNSQKLNDSLWMTPEGAKGIRPTPGGLVFEPVSGDGRKWGHSIVTRTLGRGSCRVAVKFRGVMARQGVGKPPTFHLELGDPKGPRFRILFDGRGYGMGVAALGATRRLHCFEVHEILPARGDEDETFHELALHYDAPSRRCRAFVDGQFLRASTVSFGEIQAGIGIAGEGAAQYRVTAKDFRCEFKR